MDPGTLSIVAIVGTVVLGTIPVARMVSKHLSRAVGWEALANEYPVKKQYLGDWNRKQSFYIKDTFLIDCMDVGANDEFLYFEFHFPVAGFESVQIPWEAVTDPIKRGKTIEMTIHGVKLRIRQNSFNAVAVKHLLKD